MTRISSRAELRHSDYAFPRQHNRRDGSEFVGTRAVFRSLRMTDFAAGLIVAGCCLAVALLFPVIQSIAKVL